jgi:hypothetical protein
MLVRDLKRAAHPTAGNVPDGRRFTAAAKLS